MGMTSLLPVTALGNMWVLLAGTTALYIIIQRAVRHVRRAKYARENGCEPPSKVVQQGILGLGMLKKVQEANDEHRLRQQFSDWYAEYGTTSRVYSGARSVTMTMDPQNIQTILALKFKDFGLGEYRHISFRPLLGEGIFTSDGSRWEHSRAMLRPNFTRNQIADIEIYERHVASLIKHIPRDGSTVDLQELFFRMTIDSATEFLFGESVKSLDSVEPGSNKSFARDFNIAQDGSASRLRLGPFRFLYRNKEFGPAVKNCRNYVDQFVQKAIQYRADVDSGKISPEDAKLNDQQYIFSYELSKKTTNRTEITDQLLNILLAGRDTTASLLGITFWVLARRPDVWKNLRDEIAPLDGRKPTYQELKYLTYLSWVLNEVLRLYPIVPLNSRMANKDTHLPVGGGPHGKDPLFIPKGQDVFYSVNDMHRRKDIYGEDAEEFRPERWEKLRPGWAYLPFNGGPRICIGQQFALTEAGYTVVRILQQFESIESRDDKPFTELLNLTLCSLHGTQVGMTPVGGV